MTFARLEILLRKYVEDQINVSELSELKHLITNEANDAVLNEILENLYMDQSLAVQNDFDKQTVFNTISSQIFSNPNFEIDSKKYKKHILFIIPVTDNGEIRREIVLKKCFTNDDGIVVIERGNFTVKKDERIEEHVFVNLDHTDNENNDNFKTYYSDISGYWYYSSKFYLCNKRYRAKYIGNSEIHGMETLKDYEDSIKDKIDLIWSKVDFKEIINNKEIIVELNYQK